MSIRRLSKRQEPKVETPADNQLPMLLPGSERRVGLATLR
jgi:hypothetical protein